MNDRNPDQGIETPELRLAAERAACVNDRNPDQGIETSATALAAVELTA